MERNILDFLELRADELRKLERARNESKWKFTLNQARVQARRFNEKDQNCRESYANRETYARVLTYDRDGLTEAPDLARQIRVLRLLIAEHQISPATRQTLADLATEITQDFTPRDENEPDEEELDFSPSEAQHILATSTSDARRRDIWDMHRNRSMTTAPTILRMVAQRNRAARDLGFRDFFEMALEMDEIDETHLIKTINSVIEGTDAAYNRYKKTLDAEQAKLVSRSKRSLKPWHYPSFFLEEYRPRRPVDLDSFYKRKSMAKVVRTCFSRLGIDVTGILSDSDIDPSETKHPDPLVLQIDRKKNVVRVSFHSSRTAGSSADLMACFGKAAYLRLLGDDLPYLLKRPSHPFLLDAIGRLMADLTRTPEFLVQVLGANKSAAGRLRARLEEQESIRRLMEVRFAATLIGFERGMYREPGSDLNSTWWRLIKRIQSQPLPGVLDGPDWAQCASLIHNPVSAHRTLFAEMANCQIAAALKEKIGVDSLVGESQVGAALTDGLFQHGTRLNWEEAVHVVTGKPLDGESLLAACQGI